MSVDEIMSANEAYYSELKNGIKRVGDERLAYVTTQLLKTAGDFERYEYGLIQTINAPKKTRSKIGEEIANALTAFALATVPEYELAKEVAKKFVEASITHLRGVESGGVDVQAVRGELTRAVAALAQAFSDATDVMLTEQKGLSESVDQYLREYVALHPELHENLPQDDGTYGFFCDQIHVVEGMSMDPSQSLYTAADHQMQLAYQRFVHEVQWEAMAPMERFAYLEKMDTAERRPYLESLGIDPDEWLFPGDEPKPVSPF